MVIQFHRNFKKLLKKQPLKIQIKFKERLSLFIINPFDKTLNNHALKGELSLLRSFDVTGDVRVIYQQIDKVIILFKIGSHSELY
jgi:addiction module RelE/StbE family toxin